MWKQAGTNWTPHDLVASGFSLIHPALWAGNSFYLFSLYPHIRNSFWHRVTTQPEMNEWSLNEWVDALCEWDLITKLLCLKCSSSSPAPTGQRPVRTFLITPHPPLQPQHVTFSPYTSIHAKLLAAFRIPEAHLPSVSAQAIPATWTGPFSIRLAEFRPPSAPPGLGCSPIFWAFIAFYLNPDLYVSINLSTSLP